MNLVADPGLYAEPREVNGLDECWFYHTVDVPGVGTVPGEWDLRAGVDDYLGRVPLAGKRVLELGTASGFLCFEMEKRGADVVAFDLAPGSPPDLIPLAAHPDLGALADGLSGPGGLLDRLQNSFWFCHPRFRSRAKVVYGSIYDLPAGIGPVDVATFGSILLHLRDPFLALANAARFTRETMSVTDLFHGDEWEPRVIGTEHRPPAGPPRRSVARRLKKVVAAALGRPVEAAPPAKSVPAVVFLPDPADPTLPDRLNSWWQFTPEVLRRMLGVLGFEDATVTTHSHSFSYRGGVRSVRLFTVVARRTRPMPRRTYGPYPWY